MKSIALTILFLSLVYSVKAEVGVMETFDVNSENIGITFEDNRETIVLSFSNETDERMHTVINIPRINDLEYKTRVMRYFGGLLVNNTFKFKTMVLLVDSQRIEFDWNRANVSAVVNKICRQAENLI